MDINCNQINHIFLVGGMGTMPEIGRTVGKWIGIWLLLTVVLPGTIWADSRAALIIGNSAYREGRLANPVNDARDIADALQSLGFKTDLKVDIDRKSMIAAIREFSKQIQQNTRVGLFYFAGHGIQKSGKNYLIPIDANIESEADIEFEGVELNRVLVGMASAPIDVTIVILDACRNNPFARSFRGGVRGLAEVQGPKGSFIVFATAPGMTAADGQGRNGLFTGNLLRNLKTRGLTIEQVMNKTRKETAAATSDQQIPWHVSSMTDDFFLQPPQQGQPTAKFAMGQPSFPKMQMAVLLPPPQPDDVKSVGPYRKHKDGSIEDTQLHLLWSPNIAGMMNWLEAQRHVEIIHKKGLQGHKDWRIPNKEELLRAARFAKENGGFFPMDDAWFWSATQNGPMTAWLVNMGNAPTDWNDFDAFSKTEDVQSPHAVRLVRTLKRN